MTSIEKTEKIKKEIINKVTIFIKENNHFPKRKELIEMDCSEGIIRYYFGSLYNFEQLIGLTHDRRKYSKGRVTDEMIIEEIKALYQKLGYPPHRNDYSRYATAQNRFGTNWHKVLKACHIQATFKDKTTKYSKEELTYRGRKLIKKYSRFLTWREFQKENFPVSQISCYWDSLPDFAKELNASTKWDKKYQQEKKLYSKAINTLLKDPNSQITAKAICKLAGTTIYQFKDFRIKQVKRGDLKNSKLRTFILASDGEK